MESIQVRHQIVGTEKQILTLFLFPDESIFTKQEYIIASGTHIEAEKASKAKQEAKK